MKLTAFRIRNFRSIIDTGWQSLSPDNVTCLIGQNESGKTSILEALKVFYTGIITEDILRSDLTLPEVSCRFDVPEGWLIKITDNPGTELKELLSGLTSIELTREWIADLSSFVKVSGAISQYLDSLEDAWRIYLGDVTVKLEEEINLTTVLEGTLQEIRKQEADLKFSLNGKDGKKNVMNIFVRKPSVIEAPPTSETLEIRRRLNEIIENRERVTAELKERQTIKKTGDKWKTLLESCTKLENHLGELALKLEERHQQMALFMQPLSNEDEQEWKNVLNDYRKTRKDRDLRKTELDRIVAMSDI